MYTAVITEVAQCMSKSNSGGSMYAAVTTVAQCMELKKQWCINVCSCKNSSGSMYGAKATAVA
jgi:hypothetical protein